MNHLSIFLEISENSMYTDIRNGSKE